MIKRALKAFETLCLFTGLCLVDERVKLLFLPAVAVATRLQALAAFLIRCDKGAALPVLADFYLILKEVRPTSEVLEIMRVNALGLVVFVVEGAPFCLKVKDEEVKIASFNAGHQVMHQTDLDVFN